MKQRGFTLMSKALKGSSGFTLIELLVVIAIIVILMALALTSFNASKANARDAQRKNDLNQYRVALEAYALDHNGAYPTDASGGQAWINEAGTFFPNNGIFGSDISQNPMVTEYLPSVIKPVTAWGNAYRYYYDSGALNWKLLSALEIGGFWEVCSNGKSGQVTTFVGSSSCSVP